MSGRFSIENAGLWDEDEKKRRGGVLHEGNTFGECFT